MEEEEDEYNDRSEYSPFIEGKYYRVLRKAPTWMGRLVVGEVLQYDGVVYDPDTRLTIFIFVCKGSRESKQWALADDEPLEEWPEIFCETDFKK
ncbi:MAG: hypothetical protein EOP88_22020 [Verrucomicrobiaceae bacterium]|nr:MAG: hypothetical protein EOP88_22020 [Verrucomicrobiaceae bacterium]